jgi:hypothetical protein
MRPFNGRVVPQEHRHVSRAGGSSHWHERLVHIKDLFAHCVDVSDHSGEGACAPGCGHRHPHHFRGARAGGAFSGVHGNICPANSTVEEIAIYLLFKMCK